VVSSYLFDGYTLTDRPNEAISSNGTFQEYLVCARSSIAPHKHLVDLEVGISGVSRPKLYKHRTKDLAVCHGNRTVNECIGFGDSNDDASLVGNH
jgi:hypothetical protein